MNQEKDKFWEYIEKNNVNYEQSIYEIEGDLYAKTGKVIDSWTFPGAEVLDIGNGGVINYDYESLGKLLCADLEVADRVKRKYERNSNISFIKADITKMNNISDDTFDIVVVQNVIHHLAELRYMNTLNNLHKALNECNRVLRPGGRLIVLESTMKTWAYRLEVHGYWLMMRILKWIGFDQVFQYSHEALQKEIERMFPGGVLHSGLLSTGKYTIFVGKKIPTKLLPLTFSFFIVEKSKV